MAKNTPSGIFQVGDVLNNTYRIEKVLGRGGTSEVYRARSEISGRVMAIKALRSELSRNEDFLALMTREEDMREIRHDAVVRYYDNQRTDDGHIYLVMDYVDGPGLDKKIKDGGMSAEDLMVVAKRVAEGLVVAHGRKIVHRDLSPDNIILRNGNPAEAVIIDFGIAKDANPGAETIVGNEFAGKYAYAAPEQLSGQTDERADIYSLGALLLATFRGKAPEVGRNPMEVVERKGKTLDTVGVPEPLKSLIDRMTVPDREARLSTSLEVLEMIRAPEKAAPLPAPQSSAEIDDNRTVIVPVSTKTKATPTAITKSTEKTLHTTGKQAPASGESNGGGKAGLLAGLGLMGLAAAAATAYGFGMFDAFLGSQFKMADPYTLVAERREDGVVQATGHVPSQDMLEALSSVIHAQGGVSDLILASGDLPDDWSTGVLAVIDQVGRLPAWRVDVTGGTAKVTAMARTRTQAAEARTALAALQLPTGFVAQTKVDAGPQFLTQKMLEPLLMQYGDCGELVLANVPPVGYPRGGQVKVSGRVADIISRATLSDALTDEIGDRDLVLDVEVLNPTLCLVDGAMPDAPSGGFTVVFGFGDRTDENTTGRYFVGENPVIDVVIPADVTDGFLFVSALDVSGNIFHLLPNLINPVNTIATLRGGKEGPVTTRVAYSLADARDGSKLAFKVDDTALGKTRIVVIRSDSQMFDGLRPTVESAGGYAEALRGRTGDVQSLDSRILVTAKP